MGRIITIASAKGGVGKTTTALNLGFGLSRLSKRVLIVDTDPQGGLGSASNLKKRSVRGLADILAKRADPGEVIVASRDKALSVLGFGQSDNQGILAYEESSISGELTAVIKRISEGYDYVLLDAPAGMGSPTRRLLEASEGLVIPVVTRSLSVKALPAMLRLLKTVQMTSNARLVLDGVLVTMLDYRSQLEYEIYKEIKETLPTGALFDTVIPYHAQFEEASMQCVPVAMMKDAHKAASPYLNLVMELLSREQQRHLEGESNEFELGLF